MPMLWKYAKPMVTRVRGSFVASVSEKTYRAEVVWSAEIEDDTATSRAACQDC